jgi:hypothetical protein
VILMKMKRCFFDSEKVMRAVKRAKRQALTRAGALIRGIARRSIKSGKGPAAPGQPPHSHKGQLRQFLWFAYDPDTQSVVVGPAGFARGTGAPHTLEFGDRVPITYRRRGRKVRATVKIAARPFMAPALNIARPNLPALWAGSVKGA